MPPEDRVRDLRGNDRLDLGLERVLIHDHHLEGRASSMLEILLFSRPICAVDD